MKKQGGYDRTTCACDGCRRHCRSKPGMLVPEDVVAITGELERRGLSPNEALARLRASTRTKLLDRRTGQEKTLRTVVPAQRPDGTCVFLTPDGRCDIHDVSPFGCSHFDDHMSDDRAMIRLAWAYYSIVCSDWYVDVHEALRRNE